MADSKKRDDFTVEMNDLDKEQREGLIPRDGPSPLRPAKPASNEALVSIISYCLSSIVMTTSNKYVLSGVDYNLNFFLLAVQVGRMGASKT
jgi:GDP-mannose transporter